MSNWQVPVESFNKVKSCSVRVFQRLKLKELVQKLHRRWDLWCLGGKNREEIGAGAEELRLLSIWVKCEVLNRGVELIQQQNRLLSGQDIAKKANLVSKLVPGPRFNFNRHRVVHTRNLVDNTPRSRPRVRKAKLLVH